MNDTLKYILVNGLAILACSLLLFLAGTWWRLETQFDLGEKALARGDFTACIAGYESAIHMYIPFHPKVEIAAQRIWYVAEANERQGDMARALIAYRALRSSFYALSWLTQPGTEWIARCDKRIAALVPLQRER